MQACPFFMEAIMPVEQRIYDNRPYNPRDRRYRPRSKSDWLGLKARDPELFNYWKRELKKPDNFFA